MRSQIRNLLFLAALSYILQASARPRDRRAGPIPEKDIVVQEGMPILIDDCVARSTYPSTFHWLFNGVYVEQGPLDHNARNLMSPPIEHHTVKAYTSLHIEHARPEHSGKYTCVADSPEKRTTRSYNVIVESSSEKKVTETESNEVRIYEWVDSIFQYDGKTLYIMCRATQGSTNLIPTTTWKMNGIEITENDNVKIHSNGDLEVKEATVEFNQSAGRLTCHAMSDDGLSEDTKSTFVYVFEPTDAAQGSGDSSSE